MAEEVQEAPMGSGEVTSEDKLWALLSWLLWPLAVVALLMEGKKDRPFVKYNAVNSLAFSVAWYVLGTVTVGCLFIVGLVYAIYLAIQAYQGNWVEVPFISDFVKKQGWV